MEQTTKLLFALIRSAIGGSSISADEKKLLLPENLPELIKLANKHDVAHLVVLGLKNNGLVEEKDRAILDRLMLKAVYRHEKIEYEYNTVCPALEKAQIPFIPLKGSVLRRFYPEGWMRTSCDIDILVHNEDLSKTLSYLSKELEYTELERATHDVAMSTPGKNHVEIHFDLVEEGRAGNAINILSSVWDNVSLCENCEFKYEMTDEFFYFYHIAHMAKHFETGGCGIRPFIDLFILDGLENEGREKRDKLLADGGLKKFADVSRKLSRVWFANEEMDEVTLMMQEFILHGGVYGSFDNRVMLQQKKKGGKFGYLMSRIFVPFSRLKRYYPILEKYPVLMPVMQVRRWFMLLRSDVFKMAKKEIQTNSNTDRKKAEQMNAFLDDIGL